jgi:hypothetical protein
MSCGQDKKIKLMAGDKRPNLSLLVGVSTDYDYALKRIDFIGGKRTDRYIKNSVFGVNTRNDIAISGYGIYKNQLVIVSLIEKHQLKLFDPLSENIIFTFDLFPSMAAVYSNSKKRYDKDRQNIVRPQDIAFYYPFICFFCPSLDNYETSIYYYESKISSFGINSNDQLVIYNLNTGKTFIYQPENNQRFSRVAGKIGNNMIVEVNDSTQHKAIVRLIDVDFGWGLTIAEGRDVCQNLYSNSLMYTPTFLSSKQKDVLLLYLDNMELRNTNIPEKQHGWGGYQYAYYPIDKTTCIYQKEISGNPLLDFFFGSYEWNKILCLFDLEENKLVAEYPELEEESIWYARKL